MGGAIGQNAFLFTPDEAAARVSAVFGRCPATITANGKAHVQRWPSYSAREDFAPDLAPALRDLVADGGAGGGRLVSSAGGRHGRSGAEGDPAAQREGRDRARVHGAGMDP